MHTWPNICTETMEPPLASVSNCEVRNVIWFLRACGKPAAKIHRQILAAYGKECRMSKSMVRRYFAGKRFDTTKEIKAEVTEYIENLDAEYCPLVYKSYINDKRNV